MPAGSKHSFDEQRAYKLATAEVKRANNLPSLLNHALLLKSMFQLWLSTTQKIRYFHIDMVRLLPAKCPRHPC